MILSNDTARCEGNNCPSKTNCRRYTECGSSEYQAYAALWLRREAGASACDSVIWATPVSTFKESE